MERKEKEEKKDESEDNKTLLYLITNPVKQYTNKGFMGFTKNDYVPTNFTKKKAVELFPKVGSEISICKGHERGLSSGKNFVAYTNLATAKKVVENLTVKNNGTNESKRKNFSDMNDIVDHNDIINMDKEKYFIASPFIIEIKLNAPIAKNVHTCVLKENELKNSQLIIPGKKKNWRTNVVEKIQAVGSELGIIKKCEVKELSQINEPQTEPRQQHKHKK